MSRNCFQLSVWGTFVNDCRLSASQSAITQGFCIYWNFWFAMDLVPSFCFTCQSILASISSGTKIQLLTLFLFLKARGLQEHNSSQVWFWISCPFFFFLVSKVRIGPLSPLPFHFSSLHNPQGGKLGRERRSLTLIELGNLLIIFFLLLVQIALTWSNSVGVFDYFKPPQPPTFDSKSNTISAEVTRSLIAPCTIISIFSVVFL